ncbi:MAG TPA: dihydroxy-acid dehydratase [Acetobacteraceae bacterium]|nr:dihydroxy-acid dehydratase [Acetobacteraceae bacterium]
MLTRRWDKSLPGMMMAMLRPNIPSVFMYGGSILPGHIRESLRSGFGAPYREIGHEVALPDRSGRIDAT